MKWTTRIAQVVALLGIAGFCFFGFMESFEPFDPTRQITWRIIYGLIGVASLAGVVWTVLPHKKADR